MPPDLAEASPGRQGACQVPKADGRRQAHAPCPWRILSPLQPLNWLGRGGMGTGGAGEGVPRSPAGVDPKETPFITKHLAGKLRTRHKQRLVGRRQVGRAWGAAKMGPASCCWWERSPPTQIILQPHSQIAKVLRLCVRISWGASEICRILCLFSRDSPPEGLGRSPAISILQQTPHRMLIQEISGPCFEKYCFSASWQNPKDRRRCPDNAIPQEVLLL